MLVAVKTSNLVSDNPAVAQLGIGDEVDRLFNYSLVKPSVIRDQLKAMKAEIRLWFRESSNKAKKWAIDHGVINAVIDGTKTEWNIANSGGEGWGGG
jgi:hypothetical protein